MLNKVLTLTTFAGSCLCVPGAILGSDPELNRSIAEHRMGTLTVLAEPAEEVVTVSRASNADRASHVREEGLRLRIMRRPP